MTINERNKDEEAQYDIKREAAKTSSGKIGNY